MVEPESGMRESPEDAVGTVRILGPDGETVWKGPYLSDEDAEATTEPSEPADGETLGVATGELYVPPEGAD